MKGRLKAGKNSRFCHMPELPSPASFDGQMKDVLGIRTINTVVIIHSVHGILTERVETAINGGEGR